MFYTSLVRTTEKQVADGTSQYSIAQTAVLKRNKLEMNRVQLAYTLSAAWTGGVDTVCIVTSAIPAHRSAVDLISSDNNVHRHCFE